MNSFKMKHFTKALAAGNIDAKSIEKYILHANGIWLKRLSTELIMQYVTYLEMSKEKTSQVALVEEDRIIEIHNYLLSLMSKSDGFFTHILDERKQTLVDARDYLTTVMKTLTAYGEYAELLEYILNRMESDGEDQVIDDEQFIGQVIAFIFSIEDNMVINNKVKDIYSQMPIRITKTKFYNLMEISIDKIKGITEASLDEYITYLKESFSPESVKGFGVMLGSIYEPLKSMMEDVRDTKEQENIRNMQARLSIVSEHINERVSFYMTMSVLVNLLLGIQLIGSKEVFEGEEAFVEQIKQTLLHISLRVDRSDMIDDILYHLLTNLEGIIEDTEITLGKYQGITEQLKLVANPLDVDIQTKISNELMCYRLTSGSYYGALEDPSESEIASHTYIAMKKQELTDFMKTCFANDSKWLQRSRMAHALTITNISQTNPKEIYEFIMSNCGPCKNQTEKSQSQKLIRILMKEN